MTWIYFITWHIHFKQYTNNMAWLFSNVGNYFFVFHIIKHMYISVRKEQQMDTSDIRNVGSLWQTYIVASHIPRILCLVIPTTVISNHQSYQQVKPLMSYRSQWLLSYTCNCLYTFTVVMTRHSSTDIYMYVVIILAQIYTYMFVIILAHIYTCML
jgi:hypothetical protein